MQGHLFFINKWVTKLTHMLVPNTEQDIGMMSERMEQNLSLRAASHPLSPDMDSLQRGPMGKVSHQPRDCLTWATSGLEDGTFCKVDSVFPPTNGRSALPGPVEDTLKSLSTLHEDSHLSCLVVSVLCSLLPMSLVNSWPLRHVTLQQNKQ